jgi:hypothetical protein
MAASDATLADKLAALERITRIAGWPWCIRQNASEKMEEGHYANRGVRPCADVNCAFEGTEEACDLAGYAALAKLQGRWSWRWWLVVFLAGIQGRLLMAEARAQEKRAREGFRTQFGEFLEGTGRIKPREGKR